MAKTIVGLNDAKAVKKYSGMLAVDVARESYFTKKFMGEGEPATMPIQRLTQLENSAGEQITYDLSMQLTQQPIEGDDTQEGTEEDLTFYSAAVYIDQQRGGVNGGGRMTRKRTLHDMRKVGKARMAEWWARLFDETIFVYLSGARGENADYIYPTTWAGRANNGLVAPDTNHHMWGGDATSDATIEVADKMTTTLIQKAKTTANVMGGGSSAVPKIRPIRINGEKHFVIVMHDYQEYDLRISTDTGAWLDIQKAAAAAEGRNNPIFKGGLGMVNNVVLHTHNAVTTYATFGSGSNLAGARALFMGIQAAVIAFGSAGTGLRYDWYEESRDNGNEVVISTNCIWGCEKVTFNGLDMGVMAIDTAAAAP